jgi:hypothetical protein
MHIRLIGKPRFWDDIIVNEILNLMLQSCTLIGTRSRLLVKMAIQIRIPILWERIQVWSWTHRLEMASLAHMFENFGHGCSPWIEMPLRFRTLPWQIRICILILVLERTLILILVRLNSIDVGLNIRCLS